MVEGHVSIREYSDRCDAGMGMDRHSSCQVAHVSFEQVEKNERLQLFAQVGGAHQGDNWTVTGASGPMNDFAERQDLIHGSLHSITDSESAVGELSLPHLVDRGYREIPVGEARPPRRRLNGTA